MSHVERHKQLSRYHIVNNPEKWLFAPYLVATNQERVNISYEQAKCFARVNKTYISKWRLNVKAWQNKPPDASTTQLAMKQPVFFQFFVTGAAAYLTTNINPNFTLANGSKVFLHSLSFATEAIANEIVQLCVSKPYGSEIFLENEYCPLSVNVHVPESTNDSTHASSCQEHLKQYSLDNSAIVIPLPPNKTKVEPRKSTVIPDPSPVPIGRIFTTAPFPFELAFAMTIHKAQGRTLENVIIAISQRPSTFQQMCFPSVYVAFSRVRKTDDIRILVNCKARRIRKDPSELKYLDQLRPKAAVLSFQQTIQDRTFWDDYHALRIYNCLQPR